MTELTPKEKAKELVEKFMEYSDCADEYGFAKQCALVAVNEILDGFRKILPASRNY